MVFYIAFSTGVFFPQKGVEDIVSQKDRVAGREIDRI